MTAAASSTLRTPPVPRLLEQPPPQAHLIQIYEEDAFLEQTVADFLAHGLTHGQPALVIATARHRDGLCRHLAQLGFDLAELEATGFWNWIDAHQVLAALMVDGQVSPERFEEQVGRPLERVQKRGPVRVYGELVDLLCGLGLSGEAVKLEELSNALCGRSSISLFCAYRLDRFATAREREAFAQVCTAHSHVLPTEQYVRLGDSDARHRHVAELQQKARALESEIHRRTRLEEELQQAVRLREEFLSIAGHELKTPLTPLALKLQLLSREAGRQADSTFVSQVRQTCESATRQIARLSTLVNELLDASRINAGRFELELEELEVMALVNEVAARFEKLAAASGSRLAIDGPELLHACSDRLRLEQVVTHLLDNALKYGAGKPISITLERLGDRLRLQVADQGEGVRLQDHARIFERFERVGTARDGGLGLGLYITRTIVESLGGSVTVCSEAGLGATFSVSLPLRS